MDTVDRVVRWSVAAGVGLCVVVALVAPRNSWLVFDRAVVLVSFVVGLAAWAVLTRLRPLHGKVWVGVLLGWLLGAGQAVVVIAPYGWDAGEVQRQAQVLAAGDALDAAQLEYFARYPNNLPLAAMEVGVMRVGAWVGVPPMGSLFVLNLVLYAVLLWAVGAAVARWGRPGAVWPAQAAVTLLVGLSPALAVPYSDLPAATGVAVSLALAGYAAGSVGGRRWGWSVLAGVALGAAVALKPFVVALAVAAVLVALLPSSRPARGAVLSGLVAMALTVPAATAVGELGTGLSRQELARVAAPFPVEHFLAMGTYDSGEDSEVRRYGAYRPAQVDATAAVTDPDERRQLLRETVADQVGGRSLAQNAAFFTAKVAWVWGDGTFWSQGEGRDRQGASYHDDGPLKSLSQLLRAPGEAYVIKASIVQGLWLALLTALAAGLLRGPARRVITTLALSLGGFTLYLLAFEARPRYLIAMLPVVIVLAALSTPSRPGTTGQGQVVRSRWRRASSTAAVTGT